MGDEAPPLPATDDPFVLLDVDPGADERELKRAYARRIKVYRPDRMPDAFARIHAAFELARLGARRPEGPARGRSADPPVVDEVPTAGPAAAPAARAAQVATALRGFTDAVARGDDAATRPAWAAVLAAGGTLEALVVGAPAAAQRWLVLHGEVTWRALAQWRNPQEAYAVWLTAFAARIQAPAHRAAALAMADEPTLTFDARHEPVAAMLLLKAVSCLAWYDLTAARRLLQALRVEVRHPAVERLMDRAILDVEEASREYHIGGLPALPPHVFELLACGSVMAAPEREVLATALRAELRDRAAPYLAQLTTLDQIAPRLPEALAHRLLDGVPPHRRELTSLPPALRARLDQELRAAGRWTWGIVPLGVMVLVLVLAASIAARFEGVQIDKANDGPIYAFVITFGVGLLAAAGTDQIIYRLWIRRRLARVLGRVGVTRAAARQWMQASWIRIGLRRFGWWMERDEALRLVGMLAGNVGDDRELLVDGG